MLIVGGKIDESKKKRTIINKIITDMISVNSLVYIFLDMFVAIYYLTVTVF